MLSEKQKILDEFLEEVDSQIGYRPMHAAVNEELRAHVEDRAENYMEYGLEEKEAYEKAVRDMGDASAIGIQMNEAHHLRVAKPLLFGICLLMLTGICGNIIARGFEISDNAHFLWGLLVLVLVMWQGYPFVLKHVDKVFPLFFLCGGFWIFLRLALSVLIRLGVAKSLPYALYSPSIFFGLLQLSIPAAVTLLYRRRHKGLAGLWPIYVFQAVMAGVSLASFMVDYTYFPILTLFLTCLGTVLYMIYREYLPVEQKKGLVTALLAFVLLFGLWGGLQGKEFLRNAEIAVSPEKQASSAWEDAYNNVLVRHLLGKAELFGGIRLTEEEMVRYGTSEWYYREGEGLWERSFQEESLEENFEKYVEYRMQFLENPKLTDILPQHYLDNYRFAWCILAWGWIPGLGLILLQLTVCGLMFWTAFHIRNRLGRLLAFSGSLALTVQVLLYLLGNFGVQFGAFGNLPFVSEGLVSITGTMVLAGLILSAYRFDTVLER